ncbi:hypothetical protein QQF21_17020 [Lelliottia sp. V89_10]|uniref:hypothetical protein n=1 Tax=Lelliottia wanjuensis TaxID=3050585 RepID=UPI00249E6B7B|nr:MULTISPECIES: hypothetical protein [unclassified Lelliottia]MDI3359735.1 hypothetical protein [Lelliottia sp. V89_13]MDK9548693.1 hypothetical protein [Lelliottia sp. V89_5]MDK9597325.1 hypothetical protein [Lelliottia sp. V89_10]
MSKSITLQIKQSRPDAEETGYFWKLFHAAQRVENRWYSDLNEISDELSATDLSREQKLFLLRAWQVLVDDKGGFGRFMGAFDTYVFNMQDPNDDCCAWKPELKQLIEDGNLFGVMFEAYEEALLETRRPLPIGELLYRLEEQTGEKWVPVSDAKKLKQETPSILSDEDRAAFLKAFTKRADV